MLTEKDYCDYETCVALRELGYPTKMTFIGEQATIEIPINSGLIQLYEAQKWLREEKNAIIVVCPYTHNIVDETLTWSCDVWFGYDPKAATLGFNSYEEALSVGIMKAVKLLKEKEDE